MRGGYAWENKLLWHNDDERLFNLCIVFVIFLRYLMGAGLNRSCS